MASPMPLPRARVVKKGSKIRSRMCAGTPGPLSLTTICARPSAARRAKQFQIQVRGRRLQGIGGQIQHGGHQRRRVGTHHQIRRLSADGQADAAAQRRPQPLRHLFQQGAHAHHFARGAALRERQHVIHQLVELLEAADGSVGAARQILGAAPGQRHLRGVEQRGRERRADLVRQARRQFSQRQQALLARQEHLHQMRFGHIGQQHHLAAAVQIAPGDVDESAAAQLGVLAHARADHRTCQHRGEGLSEQRLAQQFARHRIAFLNLAAGIEHQNSAGQTLDQGRQSGRPGAPCPHVAWPNSARSCATWARSESKAPDNCSDTEPKARNAACSSVRRFSIRSRLVAAMPEGESNFRALAVFILPINQLRPKLGHPKTAASIICQALRRYLRSFSTRVVRRMPRSRAASATVPSASTSALRMSPISIADI